MIHETKQHPNVSQPHNNILPRNDIRKVHIKNIMHGLRYVPSIMLVAFWVAISMAEIVAFPRYIALKYRLVEPLQPEWYMDEINAWIIISIIIFLVTVLCVLPIRGYIMQIFSHIHPKWAIQNQYIEYSFSVFTGIGYIAVLSYVISHLISPTDVPLEYKDLFSQYIHDMIFVWSFITTSISLSLILMISNNKANELYCK